MQERRIRGPLITLAAVAALGGGLWGLNVSQEDDTATPPSPVARSATVAPAPRPPSAPPPAALPGKANYSVDIPTRAGVLTLDIALDGGTAVAYACDGDGVETWLNGSARAGALSLLDTDGTGRLVGRLDGSSVAGTLWLGGTKWDFVAARVGGDDGVA